MKLMKIQRFQVANSNLQYNIVIRNMFILSIILLLIISDKKLPFSIYIPGVPFLNTLAFAFPITVSALLLLNGSIKVDIIAAFLVARILFALLTIISAETVLYSATKTILIFITALLSYLIMKNRGNYVNHKNFTLIITIFVLIISLQTIGVYLKYFTQGYTNVKSLIEIPLGKSNFIAANLLVGLTYILYIKQKNKLHYFTIFLSLISLLFTFSFGALTACFILFFISFIGKIRNTNIIKIMFLIILILCLVFCLYNFYLNYNSSSEKIFDEINKNIGMKVHYLHEGNFERLFSGRLLIYEKAIDNFSNNILLGSFFGIEINGETNFKTHNLFLEALSSYGILGFFTLTVPIFLILIKIRKNLKDNSSIQNPIYLALLIGVIHGLVEPNFYTLSFEFLWWSMAGYGLSRINNKRKFINSN